MQESRKNIKKNKIKKSYNKPELETHKINYLTNSSCNRCLTPGPISLPGCSTWYGS